MSQYLVISERAAKPTNGLRRTDSRFAVDTFGVAIATDVMEWFAAKILVKHERRWKIPKLERIENRRRLRVFSINFRDKSETYHGLYV
jgi:hypothetical protein